MKTTVLAAAQCPALPERPRAPAHACARDSRRTLTVADLAVRIRCGSRATKALLAQLAEAGFVERDAMGGWRLTERAESELGEALRGIELVDADGSTRARRRRRR